MIRRTRQRERENKKKNSLKRLRLRIQTALKTKDSPVGRSVKYLSESCFYFVAVVNFSPENWTLIVCGWSAV
jgi:hypothetical protein